MLCLRREALEVTQSRLRRGRSGYGPLPSSPKGWGLGETNLEGEKQRQKEEDHRLSREICHHVHAVPCLNEAPPPPPHPLIRAKALEGNPLEVMVYSLE